MAHKGNGPAHKKSRRSEYSSLDENNSVMELERVKLLLKVKQDAEKELDSVSVVNDSAPVLGDQGGGEEGEFCFHQVDWCLTHARKNRRRRKKPPV